MLKSAGRAHDAATGGESATGTAAIAVCATPGPLLGRIEDALGASGITPMVGAALDDGALAQGASVLVLGCPAADLECEAFLSEAKLRLPQASLVAVLAEGVSVARVLRFGVDGLVLAREVDVALAAVVEAVLAGSTCVPEVAREHLVRPVLTHREREVLALVAKGLTNREIGRSLFVAETTVKSHVASSLRKLGVTTRREAVERLADPEFAPVLLSATVEPPAVVSRPTR